jgi:hypothetical protein
MGKLIASSPNSAQVTDSTQSALTKSFSSATNTAQQYPQYANQIVAAAKTSFIDGQRGAYLAGIIAIALGAVLVFFAFPKQAREEELLEQYHRDDSAARTRLGGAKAP